MIIGISIVLFSWRKYIFVFACICEFKMIAMEYLKLKFLDIYIRLDCEKDNSAFLELTSTEQFRWSFLRSELTGIPKLLVWHSIHCTMPI